ncbi:MAG: NAD-dependent epimerase/dehydratase family protein [Pseudomonadota bacterium]
MKKVVCITGAYGFLGFHLRARLHNDERYEVRCAGRGTFADEDEKSKFVKGAEVIVHLAGLNRAPDEEILKTNVELAQDVTLACDSNGVTPQIIFSSSTHVDRDTVYGLSKRKVADHFSEWATARGASFRNLVLPNIFGEYCKPFYNSAVATFCHQLSQGETLTVNEGEVELVHAQQVCREIQATIDDGLSGEFRMAGTKISVPVLADRLSTMSEQYKNQLMPSFDDDFDLALFNSLRSYLFPKHYPVPLTLHTDNRGSLFEAIRSLNGGQCFVSTTKPGITRGNHFHHHKIERFLVLEGEALIQIRKLFSDEVHDFPVTGDQPVYIDMPPFHTHNITNTGDTQLVTLFWAHEIFDPENPDTYGEPVAQ